jgi:predicted MPP superfamily phosphohydrolase
MSNLLVIGDIHNKIALAENYINRFPDTPVIFLGDYFDDFGDDAHVARDTAQWLKESLSKPNRIHLIGNHDLPYMVNGGVMCPGWTYDKDEAVQEELGPEDWDKLKFYHYEKNYYFSHAGLTLQWFGNPVDDTLEEEHVKKVIDSSWNNLKAGLNCEPIWAADKWRGGWHDVGGLLWCDWRGLSHLYQVNQIVGHTPAKRIIRSVDEDLESTLYNVDCFLKEALLLNEQGIGTVIKQFG